MEDLKCIKQIKQNKVRIKWKTFVKRPIIKLFSLITELIVFHCDILKSKSHLLFCWILMFNEKLFSYWIPKKLYACPFNCLITFNYDSNCIHKKRNASYYAYCISFLWFVFIQAFWHLPCYCTPKYQENTHCCLVPKDPFILRRHDKRAFVQIIVMQQLSCASWWLPPPYSAH